LAFEVWQSVIGQLDPSEKITVLTNGPLTNLANIVLADKNASSVIEVSYWVTVYLFILFYAIVTTFLSMLIPFFS
jgi:hypothetical protein